MELWDREHAAAMVKLARYLISEADDRGLTHGEKHYLMQAALYLLHKAQTQLNPDGSSSIDRHEVKTLSPEDVSDIPF